MFLKFPQNKKILEKILRETKKLEDPDKFLHLAIK